MGCFPSALHTVETLVYLRLNFVDVKTIGGPLIEMVTLSLVETFDFEEGCGNSVSKKCP